MNPAPPAKAPITIRCLDTQSNGKTKTDVYLVNGDHHRWLHVTTLLFGVGDTEIYIWDQPRRMWDGSGAEYHKKGYRGPPPPMTDEQCEALALLFQALHIKPALPPGIVGSPGNWQI